MEVNIMVLFIVIELVFGCFCFESIWNKVDLFVLFVLIILMIVFFGILNDKLLIKV